MGWPEIRARAAQETAKRWDTMRCRLGADLAGPARRGVRVEPGRFFFSPGEVPQILETLRRRFPEQARAIVEGAWRISEHRFDLLGREGVGYGEDVDWHLDAVHGRRAPLAPWYRIRFLDFTEVGDHKIVWELNRHQWMTTLATAYRLTEQEHFAKELVALWYDWQRKNPYPFGINWASALEVAFRSLSWLWTRELLGESLALPAGFESDLLRALALHGRHLERYRSTYFAPNTHLLGEGVALFFIGVLCPQLPAARRWRELGWSIVQRAAERQVLADGMHFEQAIYYHVYAVDFFLHARILAERNGIDIPGALDDTIGRMLAALRDLSQAGALPRFGDDDGGRVFDPRRNGPECMTDPLSTGAILYGRRDFKAAAGSLREESLWILGSRAVDVFDAMAATLAPPTSVRLPASGIHAMVDALPARRQLFIDAGPQGAFTGGHGHADALSVQLAVDGAMWLIDPGTASYVPPTAEREAFRRTAAHNTLEVDGRSQAEPTGPFSWRRLTQTRAEAWVTGGPLDLFVGSHDGYRPIVHRRFVVGLRSRLWAVRDLACGDGRHRLESRWHLSPRFEHDEHIPGGVILSCASARLACVSGGPDGWRQQVETTRWSPTYGITDPCLVLHGSAQATLPAEIFTLIIPLDEAEVPGRLEQLGPGAWRYRVGGRADYFFFADTAPLVVAGWRTDAAFAYCQLDGDAVRNVFLHGGHVLERHGMRVSGAR